MQLVSRQFGDENDCVPLVLLHGLFGSGRNWTSIAKQIARKRRVAVLDLPNHGDSPWSDRMDYPVMAEAVRVTLNSQRICEPVILGHSMGGKVAMVMALMWPKEVRGMISLDIAPASYRQDFASYIQAMRRIDLERIRRRAEAEMSMETDIPEAAIRSFLCQNLVASADGGWRWRVNLNAIDRNLPTLVGFPTFPSGISFHRPSLFLKGGQSDYVRSDHTKSIRELFPLARLQTVVGAGHWVHADRPGEVISVIEEFCECLEVDLS